MESTQITCDVCLRIKGETNHWFKAVFDPIAPVGIAFGTSDATIGDPTGLVIEHICGQECLLKRLSRWVATPNPITTPERETA